MVTLKQKQHYTTGMGFQFFLSCISGMAQSPKTTGRKTPFNSFLVASELFYPGGVYIFNAFSSKKSVKLP
jgi:hypothetical protein